MIDFEALAVEERPQAKRIAEWFAAQHPKKAVLDIGCGPGLYVEEMHAAGVEAYGVDNDERLVETLDIVRADLLTMPGSDLFPIVLSLEVGEHLFESQSRRFVEVLTSHATELVYFSAAAPGQGGDGHFNMQPKPYWISRFEELGWHLDLERSEAWLSFMRSGPHMGWLLQNGMIFSQ